MGVRFGTDGIRGLANVEVTPELALALGRATARHLPSETFLVGRDPRRSGPMLLAALAAGLAAEGGRVLDLGVVPTPALAWLAASRRHPGAMISASHNPFPDNGIKLFSDSGSKLGDDLEAAIAADTERFLAGIGAGTPTGAAVGEIAFEPSAPSEYEAYLASLVEIPSVRRLRIVCDCGNGAASELAPRVLARLNLDVSLIGTDPDGININDGVGATDVAALASAVVASSADLGVAFDGDADRCIAVDEHGEVVDGDRLLALFALDMQRRGALIGDTVVVTVMSNLGLRRALVAAGIEVLECPVGDRAILERLESLGLALGGEQSGHIVFRRDATTGDGLLSALRLLELVARSDRPLSELAREAMTRLPQELRTVRVPEPSRFSANERIAAAIAEVEASLGADGRVLVRASGTEAAVRVMVEALDVPTANDLVERLASLVAEELGSPF